VDVVDDEDGFTAARGLMVSSPKHEVLVVVSSRWKEHVKSNVSSKNKL
jgi:hypothetical protein